MFQLSPAWVYLHSVGGMALTFWMGYKDLPLPFNPFFFATSDQIFVQYIIRWIFWIATTIHLVEAMYTYPLAKRIDRENRWLWVMQSVLIGGWSIYLLKKLNENKTK